MKKNTIQRQGFEVPKITLGVSDSLGLTELRKAVILTVAVYYRKRIQIKISKG